MPCRRLWQMDWAEHSPDGGWNLLCPGPSLEDTVRQVDSSRPTMAVNAAIRSPKPVSFWCSYGAPTDTVHKAAWRARGAGGALSDPRIILTSGAYLERWHTWFSRLTRTDPWVVGQHKLDPIGEDWKAAGLDEGPSWMCAIRAMVLRGGAKRINVYGLDLEGEGYSYGAPDPRRRDAPEWEGRWVGERVLLERALELLESIGVELVRVR